MQSICLICCHINSLFFGYRRIIVFVIRSYKNHCSQCYNIPLFIRRIRMMMVIATANTRDVITIPMATPTPIPVYNNEL